MKIAGVSNFHVSSFTNIKPVKVVSMPERPKHTNNSVGGSYIKLTPEIRKAARESWLKMQEAFQASIANATRIQQPDWHMIPARPTILGPTGEPLLPVPQLYMHREHAESAGLAIMSDVDIKI